MILRQYLTRIFCHKQQHIIMYNFIYSINRQDKKLFPIQCTVRQSMPHVKYTCVSSSLQTSSR